jgi:glutathione synthase/RimK-type ligase-like ATP-grasp enzyme
VSYYIPLQLTYEALGYAVITDDEKQNYFIYSEDNLRENPNWKSIEKMQGIFAALGKLTGNVVTLRYEENEKCLYFENEAESIGIPAAFSENAYVRVSDAVEAYKKLANTDIKIPNTAFISSF